MIFLLADSLMFWLFIGAFATTASVLAIRERVGWATSILIAGLLGLQFFSTFKPFVWIADNPLLTVEGVAAYIIVGVLWVYPKWYSFIGDVHRVATEARETATTKYRGSKTRISGVTSYNETEYVFQQTREAIQDAFGSVWKYNSDGVRPSAQRNKGRIFGWMIYWPVSMLWTAINDPVRKLYEAIYRAIAGSLQRMSDRRFADFDA